LSKRGKVWLAVAGLVVDANGDWLVVKKRYSGLKNQWSLPAGFVNEGETADEAVLREVAEETGIQCSLKGMIGLRTGVIRNEISDNMILFLLEPQKDQVIQIQHSELFEACYMAPAELMDKSNVSVMLQYLMKQTNGFSKPPINNVNPGDHFEYTAYKLFF